jgi:hypothetical protein
LQYVIIVLTQLQAGFCVGEPIIDDGDGVNNDTEVGVGVPSVVGEEVN